MRWAVAHLVGHYEVCTRYLRAALDEMGAAEGSARYDALLAGVLDQSASGLADIRAELLEATTLWGKIEHTLRARRRDLIVGDSLYHTWAIAERLLGGRGRVPLAGHAQRARGVPPARQHL